MCILCIYIYHIYRLSHELRECRIRVLQQHVRVVLRSGPFFAFFFFRFVIIGPSVYTNLYIYIYISHRLSNEFRECRIRVLQQHVRVVLRSGTFFSFFFFRFVFIGLSVYTNLYVYIYTSHRLSNEFRESRIRILQQDVLMVSLFFMCSLLVPSSCHTYTHMHISTSIYHIYRVNPFFVLFVIFGVRDTHVYVYTHIYIYNIYRLYN